MWESKLLKIAESVTEFKQMDASDHVFTEHSSSNIALFTQKIVL